MKHSAACRILVEHWESLQLRAYPDPRTGGAPWTIGYGHTGPEVHPGLTWTEAKADAILELDLATADAGVNHLVGTARTTQAQFDALASLAENVGATALHGSHLIAYHVAGRFIDAATEFAKWDKAKGREMAGLLNRRRAEAALYLGRAA